MKKIEDVQNEFAQAVRALTPDGYTPVVKLKGVSGRKTKKNAAARNWDPLNGTVSITFSKLEEPPVPSAKVLQDTAPKAEVEAAKPMSGLSQALAEAIRALDVAERRVSFVALKWFRDQFLPSSGASWATMPYAGQVIKDAIDRGLFLKNQVQNPKAPAFPTTAIRLNRQMPEVQKILGTSPTTPTRNFHPVEITGEPLSATIIRERR